jgi:WD40 repeat protein
MTLPIDPAKLRLLQSVPAKSVGFWCGVLDSTGKRLYAGGTDFCIHAFDLPAVQPAKLELLKGHDSYVTALVAVPAIGAIISGGFDKRLLWWHPPGDRPVHRVDAGARVNRLAISADGNLVGAALEGLTAAIWNAHTGQPVRELTGGHAATTGIGRRNTLYCMAFSPDGKQVATGDRAGTICTWETATGKLLHKAAAGVFYSQALSRDKLASEYEWGGVRSLAFAPDGKMLVAGGMGPADQNSAGIDGPMRLEAFDPATGKSLAAFMAAPKGMLTTLLFHAGGDWVIAAGGGGQAGSAGIGSIWLWNRKPLDKDKKPVAPLTHKSDSVVREVLVSPDGGTLYTVGMQRDLVAGRIEVWDLTGKAPVAAAKAPKK